jgi:alanine racemase
MTGETPRVEVDLSRVRANVAGIARAVGVGVIAVVKADAYGLGAARVAAAIAELVDGFYVFEMREAIDADLPALGKPILALRGDLNDADEFLRHRVRPAVWTADRAAALRAARPVLAVDTGQQRFACPPDEIAAALAAGAIDEAFTHATRAEQAAEFESLTGGLGLRRHAAGSALLDQPAARFDAVRPGLAMYDGAVRVTLPLIDARDTRGPAGYTGFQVPRFGVIAAGYSHGLRPGPASVGGRLTRILEVGMQTSFVELGPGDEAGDEVVLLGDEIPPALVAAAWGCSPQQVLVCLCRAGGREYRD